MPFCARRCSYCDFAIAVRRQVPVDEYLTALTRELDLRVPAPTGVALETLYLGGGTPSRLGADGIARLVGLIRRRFDVRRDAEVTIEANPEDVTPAEAAAWRAAGVTRVSLGVQSFDDTVLQWMHRTHDSRQVTIAVDSLRAAGIDDWSLDLIFALPPEVPRRWSDDLARAIALEPPHVSCYGLTVELHTPLVRWRERGVVHDADEERYGAEFLEADRLLGNAGYVHYEVSNYARPGRHSRHNSAYWNRVPYLGLGPSAHSYDGSRRSWNFREYAAWRSELDAGKVPIEGSEELGPEAVTLEQAYLGLRSRRGLPLTAANQAAFSRWSDRGWAVNVEGRGRLTPEGWLRLDALVTDLTDFRSR